MKIVNLTPHTLNIHNTSGDVKNIPPSGDVARVDVTYRPYGRHGGVDLYRADYGAVVGLPDPKLDHIYVVSGMVAQVTPRPDVYSPGQLVRDGDGRPVGCQGLKVSI